MIDKIKQFKISFGRFAKKNILTIIMLVLLCPILGYSYSTFVFDTNNYRSNEMYIGNLLYSIKVDGVNTSSVSVPANSEVEAIVQVTSLNEVSSNYKLVYNEVEGVTVVYAEDEDKPTYGLITTLQNSTVLVTNTTNQPITINFEVVGGYNTNSISNLTAPTGYSLVTNTYMKYDYETLSMFVDNVRVTELDLSKKYNLISSNCTNNETVTYNSTDDSLLIIPYTEQTKCILYFEEIVYPTLSQKMLADNNEQSDSGINFAAVSSSTNGQGLYYTSDLTKTENGEKVYYYRGAVTNNYVQFAGFCWKIIRTNEDGSVKLMYWGEKNGTSCSTTSSMPSSLSGKTFNASYSDNRYVGYMYGTNCNDYASCHLNATNSNIKGLLDAWYLTNIYSQGAEITQMIANTKYCNDRSIGNSGRVGNTTYGSLGYGMNSTLYSTSRRIGTGGPTGTTQSSANASPQYKCSQDDDAFTLKVAKGGTLGFGNNILDYPVGLLTADEMSFAGGSYNISNNTYYLYTGQYYWTMSPYGFDASFAYNWIMYSDGHLGLIGVYHSSPGAYPVISLNSSALVLTGDGSASTPYVIQ